MSIKIITSIDGGGSKEGKGWGGGEGDLTYRQRSRKLVLQNTPTRNFFKIVSSGPHLANQCVTMVKALASVHVCNSGPTTKLLVLRLDILKITNPKPVTKLYGNYKAKCNQTMLTLSKFSFWIYNVVFKDSAFRTLELVRGSQHFSETTPTVWIQGDTWPSFGEIVTRYPLCGASKLRVFVDCFEGKSNLTYGLISPQSRYESSPNPHYSREYIA